MRDYGSVHTRFWINRDIQKLSDASKLLALYLLTGPHANMLGCFRLPLGYACEDLHWASEIVSTGLNSLSQIHFALYDSICGWVFLPQFLIWNPIENPNQGKNITRLFEQVPKKVSFLKRLIDVLVTQDKYLEEAFKRHLEVSLIALKTTSAIDTDITLTSSELPKIADALIEPPIITITLNDRSEFPIAQQKVDEWQVLYPAVDVLQALRNIRAWNDANPTRRKTKSGILRHVVAWLSKEQNQSRTAFTKNSMSTALDHVQARNRAVAKNWLNKAKPAEEREIIILPENTP